MTFKVRTLKRIGQLLETTASAVENNIDIACIQEHRYYHYELEIKYHNTGNGRTFVSVSAWKNSIKVIVGGVVMLLSCSAIKSLNSIEKIQTRIMYAS